MLKMFKRPMTQPLPLSAILCAQLVACSDISEVGSQCTEGRCEALETAPVANCLVTQVEAQLVSDFTDSALCLDTPYPRDANGLVPCDIYWVARDPQHPPPALEHCSGFLSPATPGAEGALRCRVAQVPVFDRMAPTSGAGIYYAELAAPDGPSDCKSGFRYTQGVTLPAGAKAMLHCTLPHLRRDLGQADIEAEQCSTPQRLAESSQVGESCILDPVPGTHERGKVYLDTSATGCGAGVCLGYFVGPEFDTRCDSSRSDCIDDPIVRAHTHCSCRCDSPRGEQPECDCPSGFACTPAITTGFFAGSYCVRQDANAP